jgi:phosphatidylethanolamine/phosphatidyl-N-methylethanolamine N-methyltransferase
VGDSVRRSFQMDIDEAARFDRLAPFYDLAMLPTELVIRRRRRELLRQVRGRVLEIGIGTGATLTLYPPMLEVIGVDLSWRMLERAARRARRLGWSVPLARMAANCLALRDGIFDTVVLTLVLCSVEDLPTALAECRRVLAPEGRLLLLEHVRPPGRLGTLFDRLDPFWYRRSCHLNRRTEQEVERAGFRIESHERWMFGIFMRLVASRPPIAPLRPAAYNQEA